MKRPSWWLVAILCAIAYATGLDEGGDAEKRRAADVYVCPCDECDCGPPELPRAVAPQAAQGDER
jgi:hypothetical protein